MATQTLEQVKNQFHDGRQIEITRGEGGLTLVKVKAAGGEGHVYLHGAHVAHFQPVGHTPVLYMCRQSWFQNGKPIRGGVPVCFPWFGMRDNPPAGVESPNHGFVRLVSWTLESVARVANGDIELTLVTSDTDETRKVWAHPFEIRHRVRIGAELRMALEVRNHGAAAFTFSEALHTYFAVSDVRRVAVMGLKDRPYVSKSEGGLRATQNTDKLSFTKETDRVFMPTADTCVLEDSGAGRRITIAKHGSQATVVWNPYGVRPFPDMGEDEWPKFACVETVNALETSVALPAGGTHVMEQRIAVQKM